jgi:deoxycytidylate deaminase
MGSIIGLTGSFGSGCTFLAQTFLEPMGYKIYSLSQELKELYQSQTGKEPDRGSLQDFGNELRRIEGPDYLAKKTLEKIQKEIDRPNAKILIDSIRNPAEIHFLRSLPEFFLFGIYANKEVRWERVQLQPRYNKNQKIFDTDDDRDKGEDFDFGQRVTDCFLNADIIINNEAMIRNNNQNYHDMRQKLQEYTDLITGAVRRVPTEQEALMAIAFANSQRSNCLKRKVGAVIIDASGHILGSGYNEVPSYTKTCLAEYGECYRGTLRKNWANKVNSIVTDPGQRKELIGFFNDQFKILDYCKSLHAEESAILAIAKNGSSALKGATLYTSTYPCNLCANKILEVGIQRIYYLEPYPMPEAKRILWSIKQSPFEGVTYNGYFRIFRG